MQVYPAELVDVNLCCQIDTSYTTDYVWQMQARESERSTDIRFSTVRLPRSMHVEYPRPIDDLVKHWQQDGCFLVIRNELEEIVGFLDAQPRVWQNLLWISHLVVTPYYRRRGFGTRLLKSSIQWALGHNLEQLMLETQTKNYPAIAFALKHGFEFCGYHERYYPNGDIALFFSRSV